MNKHSYKNRTIKFDNTTELNGDGILKRDDFPETTKKLLEQIKDEEITKMTLYRYPLPDVTAIAKIASGGRIPYDNLYHLGVHINDKYRLDKDALLTFEKAPFPTKDGTEKMELTLPYRITVGDAWGILFKKYKRSRIFNYDAIDFNCQRFMMDWLSVWDLDKKPEIKKWVLQDPKIIKSSLPSFSQGVSGVINDLKLLGYYALGGKGDYEN